MVIKLGYGWIRANDPWNGIGWYKSSLRYPQCQVQRTFGEHSGWAQIQWNSTYIFCDSNWVLCSGLFLIMCGLDVEGCGHAVAYHVSETCISECPVVKTSVLIYACKRVVWSRVFKVLNMGILFLPDDSQWVLWMPTSISRQVFKLCHCAIQWLVHELFVTFMSFVTWLCFAINIHIQK